MASCIEFSVILSTKLLLVNKDIGLQKNQTIHFECNQMHA